MEYLIPGIDFTFQPDAYKWDMTKTPKVTSFPHTFTTPIPFSFKIRWGYFDRAAGNVQVEHIVEGSGTMTGYAADSYRPYIALQLAQPLDPEDPENLDSIGLTIYNDSITFDNDIVITETLIHDDIVQHTDTYNTFNQIFRRTTWEVDLTSIWMDVEYCDLPIIMMYGQVPVGDDEYIYQQTEYTQISASQIPTLDRIMSWSGNSYIEPEGKDFSINVIGAHVRWDENGQHILSSSYIYQALEGKIISGNVALYEIPGISGGKLKYGIKSNAEFYGLRYSTDGSTYQETPVIPFSYILRKREEELGVFDAALSMGNTTIPIFDSEINAQGFINGSVDIENALNWDRISGEYPLSNKTGDEDSQTIFGSVFTRSIFTQQYMCNVSAVQDIANALYDTSNGGLWENIKKGVEMFGDSPIESVINLTYYPLNLHTVFTQSESAPDIYFGGYKHTLRQGSASKILYPDGYFSCGTVVLKRSTNTYKDFPPYTRIFVDIPYCGSYEIDPAKYYGKTTELRYYIDTRAYGACVACLIADGHLVDQWNGQLGVGLPMTLTDYSSYANAQIQTLLGNGGQAVSGGLDVAQGAAQASSAAGLALGAAGVAGFGAVAGAKTIYGLSQNNINKFNKTRGGSTGMLNQYLPQKAVFTIEIQEEDIPGNFYQLQGGASNAGGTVGSFSGYLEVDQIKLNMPGATENEKAKARALLMGGVFI